MSMEKKSLEEDIEESPIRLQLFLTAGIIIIGSVGVGLAVCISMHVLRLDFAMSLIAGFRVLLVLGFSIIFLPMAVFGEFWYSKWKKRSFRPRNVALLCIPFGECLLVMIIVATFFEMLFPRLELVDQAPILGISVGAGLIAIALTSRICRIN
jgi:hypothetical protein